MHGWRIATPISGLTRKLFRSFIEDRPHEEHWELIDGVAMMMAPPTRTHQRIERNLERLLLDALERHNPALTAFQAIGVNLAPDVEDYDPEPDVVIVDSDETKNPDERYVDRFYLAAEIVSASDRTRVEKARGVQLHQLCACILTIQQAASKSASTCARPLAGPNGAAIASDLLVLPTWTDLRGAGPIATRTWRRPFPNRNEWACARTSPFLGTNGKTLATEEL